MSNSFIGIDVGTKRIGVAAGDDSMRIAYPLETVVVDGNEVAVIMKIARERNAQKIIVGYPRNQSGEPTKQTAVAENMAKVLEEEGSQCVLQDESVTSVLAEEQLKMHGQPYTKEDIDKQAAAIILQDFLEQA